MTTLGHSMRVLSRGAALALVASVLLAGPLSAQGDAPKMIPVALVNAALDGFGEMVGGIAFVVGTTPTRWPRSLVAPAGVRVVGGATLGPLLTTLYEFPSNRDAIGAFEAQLLKAGFTRADSAKLASRSGFTSTAKGNDGRAFCGVEGAVVVSQVDSTRTTRSITVVLAPDQETSTACSSNAVPGRSPMPLKIPILRPPPGVSATSGGHGSSGNGFEARVRVDTTLHADEVLAHYAKELAGGGWQLAPAPVLGEGVALHQVSARDEKGEEWHGVLVVMTLRSQREVTLRMIRDRE